jgi:hypothetical protein
MIILAQKKPHAEAQGFLYQVQLSQVAKVPDISQPA